METLSTTLSSLQRKRASNGYPIGLSNMQLTGVGRDQQLPLTNKQVNRVKKAMTGGKGVVLRFKMAFLDGSHPLGLKEWLGCLLGTDFLNHWCLVTM